MERQELELTLDRMEIRPSVVPLAERRPFAINTGGLAFVAGSVSPIRSSRLEVGLLGCAVIDWDD